nr:hypothetical protein Iba_chr12cCG6690 [Ipomoea batatas]
MANLPAAETIIATIPPARIPNPCIANTAALKAPRVFFLAYSDMMVAESARNDSTSSKGIWMNTIPCLEESFCFANNVAGGIASISPDFLIAHFPNLPTGSKKKTS